MTKNWQQLGSEAAAAKKNEKQHCVNGHPFSGDNLIIQADGYRLCKTCRRNRLRAYRAALPLSPPNKGQNFRKSNEKRNLGTHCKWGHEQKGDNVKILAHGTRKCMVCYRKRLVDEQIKRAAKNGAPRIRKIKEQSKILDVKIFKFDDEKEVEKFPEKPDIIRFGQVLDRDQWLRLHGVKRKNMA